MQAETILTRNAVRVTGEGRPMIFLHGFGCDQTMWDRIVPEFVQDHQVILYDLTGMGASDIRSYDPVRHASLRGHAEDLIEILEALDVPPAIAVTHSVSAIIAALAEIDRPDLFSSLIMIGPSPCYIDDPPYKGGFKESDIQGLLETMEENYLGWAGSLASLVAGPEADDAKDRLETRFCRNDPEISKHFAEVTFLSDNRSDLPKVKAPTLVIQSKKDSIADPAVGEYVHAQIPNSEIDYVDNTGHAPHMTNPEAVTRSIREYLQGQ